MRTSKSLTLLAAAVVVVAVAVPVAAAVAPHLSSSSHRARTTTTADPPARHVARSAQPKPPPAAGYFETLPPGAPLPSGAECAARVHRSTWEPRPENTKANHTIVKLASPLPANSAFDATWQQRYKPRINGDFSGTTDEIIQWASCKWGISDNLTRARAVDESSWRQSKVGDFVSRSTGHCPPGWSTSSVCPTSFGLLQSKWYFRPGVYPATRESTAFNVDSVLAETRGCLDGLAWFGPVSRGNVWGCVGLWFSGQWQQNDAQYIAKVKSIYSAKPWLSWKG